MSRHAIINATYGNTVAHKTAVHILRTYISELMMILVGAEVFGEYVSKTHGEYWVKHTANRITLTMNWTNSKLPVWVCFHLHLGLSLAWESCKQINVLWTCVSWIIYPNLNWIKWFNMWFMWDKLVISQADTIRWLITKFQYYLKFWYVWKSLCGARSHSTRRVYTVLINFVGWCTLYNVQYTHSVQIRRKYLSKEFSSAKFTIAPRLRCSISQMKAI